MTQTFEECDDFLLGRDILVASVVEGQRQRRVWLPANETGWYDFYTHEWFCGGQWIVRDAPLEKLPLLVARSGCRSASESNTLARRRMIPVS
jgi:alpha-glucosidase